MQLRDILASAPGVYGARFSGAGFRGCCVALVAAGFYITQLELLYYLFLMIKLMMCDLVFKYDGHIYFLDLLDLSISNWIGVFHPLLDLTNINICSTSSTLVICI